MYLKILLQLSPLLCISCSQPMNGQVVEYRSAAEIISKQGKTINTRFTPPAGYERKRVDEHSFAGYLRNIPLKPHGALVHYYNGGIKPNDDIYSAVMDMDIGKQNLQQCADAVMRLRAEYLLHKGQADKIHFNFTSGFRADYSKWQSGYRIAVQGSRVSWVKRAERDNSYAGFRAYMDMVFSYAGTLSLSRELEHVQYGDLQPGDVLIQGGSPGHAVIVADVAENNMGKKIYLLAQSYMPAQEIQVLNNPGNKDISPWYELDSRQETIETPQWKFTTGDLKRFSSQ